jgi:hypothetical protein
MWIAVFLRMARQFNWIDTVITPEQDTRQASVAKNKLIGKAAFWLDTERRGGAETDIWDTIHPLLAAVPLRPARIGLKDGLIAMFKVDISQLEATEAVMDLVMKSNETINVFYVRVKWAMEVRNHSISMADKALAPYIADRDRDLFTFFLAGVSSKYREFAMSGENPPTDPTTLRKRCAQLEAMQSRTKRIAALAAKTKEIAALKAEIKCFNCQKKGHFASSCPDPKKPKAGRALTALTLATPAPARWAILSIRTSTTEGLGETRPGKWDPHSHFPGRWQHYQQQQQQLCCQHVEDYPGHLVLRRGTSRRHPTPSTSNRGRKSQNRCFI